MYPQFWNPKVGDRVKIISNYLLIDKGIPCIIDHIDNTSYIVHSCLSPSFVIWVEKGHIEADLEGTAL